LGTYFCPLCQIYSQFYEGGYLHLPKTATIPTYTSTSTKYWKSAPSTTVSFSYSLDED